MGTEGCFQLYIIISVSSSLFIWTPMLWVHDRYKYFYFYSVGIDFTVQNPFKVDSRSVRVKFSSWKGMYYYAAVIHVAFFSLAIRLQSLWRKENPYWLHSVFFFVTCCTFLQALVNEVVKTLNLSDQPLFHWPKHSSDRRSRWYLGQCTPKKIYKLTWWWWLDDYSGLTAPNSGISVRTKLILTGSHTSEANCRPTCYSACNCSLSFNALQSIGNLGSIILQTQNQVS